LGAGSTILTKSNISLGTGHKVEGGSWAMKNWGWVTSFQNVKKGGSGKKCTELGVGRVKLFTYHPKRQ